MNGTHIALLRLVGSYSLALRTAQRVLGVVIAIMAVAAASTAQTTKPTDGSTPLGLEAGAPQGAYSLSGFDNVNLYNGSLNFSLPLLKIGGRGTGSHTIILPIERHWMMEKFTDEQQNIWVYPIDGREEEIKPGYGPGVMAIRYGGIGGAPCEPHPPNIQYGDSEKRYTATVTRLSFTRPDGGETEFRDLLRGGGYAAAQLCGNHDPASIGFNRGKVFVSVDGSLMTFISDSDVRDEVIVGSLPPESPLISGFMLLPDGTRYRIDAGLVTSIRDRNGNKITFVYGGGDDGYQVRSITDSLNRQVTIAYDFDEGGQYGVCDKITYKGFGGASRVIRVSKTSLGNVLRSGYSLTTYGYLFPNGGGGGSYYNPTVVSSVWLPDSDGVTRRYQFQYNNYGELARVALPTGGAYEYDFGAGTTNGTSDGLMFGYPNQQIYRRVVERRVYPNGGTGSSYDVRMTYSVPETQDTGSTTSVGYVIAEQRDVHNNLLSASKHYFSGPGAGYSFIWHSPIVLQSQMDGKENQTEVFDTNGTTVLRRAVSTWEAGAPIASNPAPINARVIETTTTLEPSSANLVSKQTFSYDQYNNQTDVYEYDYGNGSAGSLVRRSQTTYLTTQGGYDYACDPASSCSTSANVANAIHIRNRPTQTSIYDSGAVERARTAFEYDNYASDANHAPLVYRGSISGFDSAFTPSYTTRGNSTASTQYLLVNGTVTGSITAYAQYDMAGNPVKSIDFRGYATLFDFTDRFGSPDGEATSNAAPIELSSAGQASYAFPTLVTNAANHTTYSQFDFYLGRPVNAEDANGIVFAGSYNDALDRPTQVIRDFNNPTATSQTTFSYNETNRTITTTSDQTTYADNTLKSQVLYDGMGRTTESRQYEGGSNYIAVQKQYDALGRAFKTSNPFRPWQSETAVWTTNAFDALGRVTSVTTPDNAVVATAYASNTVTVTDQAGKQRKSVTDALGRPREVYEAPNDANFNHLTGYSYDTLDNLITVNQGSQTRTFAYDSLKRLTSATNPESGTVSYQYDNNGNLLVKTEARGVSVHYEHDTLNRATRRWYNGSSALTATTHNSPALPSGVGASDEVKYFYDAQSLPSGAPTAPEFSRGYATGRLVAVTYGGGSNGDYYGYDALGRVDPKIQRTGAVNYKVDPIYNLAGAIRTMTYPSERTVTNDYDTAGRLNSFSGTLGGTTRTYANQFEYTAWNGLQQEKFGTDTAIYHKQRFNQRGQLWDMRASTVPFSTDPADGDRGAIANYYSNNFVQGGSGADNNGNLLRQENYIPGSSFFQDNFAYDSLNRLSSISQKLNGTGNDTFKQSYSYDRWGNRKIKTNPGDTFGTGINNLDFEVDNGVNGTNRLYAPGDLALPDTSRRMQYDQAGNLKTDTYTGEGTRTYDAENKMKQAWSNNQWQTYAYDGDGRRIKRIVNGTETWQVYGLGGELLAEYAANAAATSPQKEYGYRNGELLITAEAPAAPPINVALAANGATASASSAYPGFAASGTINGERKGLYVGQNGYWSIAQSGFPAWLEVNFAGSQTISEIDVFTVQDNYNWPVEPTESMTFSQYGVTGYEVQYWTGSSWVTITGGSVTGNDKVWRKFTFTPLTTTKIRVLSNASADNWSRLTEIEAWTGASPAPRYDLALAANGAVATASNSYNAGYGPSGTNNGDRKSLNWTNGGGWNDSGPPFPDWLQIDFGAVKTIDEIDVFTLQDNWSGSAEPTESMTFTQWGLTGYEVQYWDGTNWVTVPGGNVTGNNKVWRKFTFAPVITSKIRVLTNASVDGYSRITEVEAYGPAASGSSANIRWLVADHLGTPRMVFDQTGSLANVSRHDYLPFGEELFAGTGGRTTAQGYSASDNVRQHFSGKERDNETGLDYFVNRYYASTQGRFTSVDPIKLTPGRLLQPQRLNLYSYTINNPLNLIDPDGKDIDFVNDTKEGRRKALLSITANMTAREARNVGVRYNKDTQKYEGYVKDPSKINLDKASQGYKDFSDRVNNHDLKLNYAFLGKNDSATIELNGVQTKVTQKSLIGSGGDTTGFVAPQSDGSFAVIVSAAGYPPGVAGLTASGRETTIAMPNYILAAHELFAETYKYTPEGRRQGLDREENIVDDSNKVIDIENKYRDFHGLPHRSGTDHGYIHAPTVTVRP